MGATTGVDPARSKHEIPPYRVARGFQAQLPIIWATCEPVELNKFSPPSRGSRATSEYWYTTRENPKEESVIMDSGVPT